eukprot:7377460-Prymnesium_polylepis.2
MRSPRRNARAATRIAFSTRSGSTSRRQLVDSESGCGSPSTSTTHRSLTGSHECTTAWRPLSSGRLRTSATSTRAP